MAPADSQELGTEKEENLLKDDDGKERGKICGAKQRADTRRPPVRVGVDE